MLIWCSANIFSSFSFIFCNIINAFDASLLNKSNTFLKNTKLLNGSVYYSYYVMYLFRPFKRFVAFLRWYVKFKTLKLAKSKMYFPVFFVQYALDCRRSEYVAESMSIWFLILFEWLWTQRNNAVSFFLWIVLFLMEQWISVLRAELFQIWKINIWLRNTEQVKHTTVYWNFVRVTGAN